MKTSKIRVWAIDLIFFVLGGSLYALGLYTFALNAGFAVSGVSGLAIIIRHFFERLPVGTVAFILNIPLAIISARVVGREFLFKSMIAMVISTLFIDGLMPLLPTYGGSQLLACIFAGALIGAGIALIFTRGASTGGMDFAVMIIKKKRPHLSVGGIYLVADFVVILLGGLAFKNIDAVLYGAISSAVTNTVLNYFLYGFHSSKLAIIITSHGQAIADAISVEISRGSTLMEATGAYTGNHRQVLLCVCGRNEIFKVRAAARSIDPGSMVILSDAAEVLGEGFHPSGLPGHEDPAENLARRKSDGTQK